MGFIIVGIVSGVITGLGMGGGSVLILVLVSMMGIEQHVAQAINLIFFIPTAMIAIWIHARNKNIEKRISKKLFFTTTFGSAIGAYFTTLVNAQHLRRYFGFFLLVVRYLRNNSNNKRTY